MVTKGYSTVLTKIAGQRFFKTLESAHLLHGLDGIEGLQHGLHEALREDRAVALRYCQDRAARQRFWTVRHWRVLSSRSKKSFFRQPHDDHEARMRQFLNVEKR